MSVKDRLLAWGITLGLLFLFLFMVKSILLPFVVAMITAYFLDPAADKLEDFALSRFSATLTITISFFIIAITGSLLLMPLIYDQIVSFAGKIPEYSRYMQQEVLPVLMEKVKGIDPNALENIQGSISDISKYVLTISGNIASGLWNSGVALLNLLSLLFITPIVTFYILRDWDIMRAKISAWLPVKHKEVILEQFSEIDRTLSGYIRGQTNVCLLLGAFYAVGLMIIGLDFGLMIGMMTGILSFIPYVGLLVGMTVGLGVAFIQYGGLDGITSIGMVALVFVIGQVIEGNFVSPKLVGDKVGLHPVWIMFGMLAGTALFGFIGILLSVPVTAVLGVLIRFSLKQYLQSGWYGAKDNASLEPITDNGKTG